MSEKITTGYNLRIPTETYKSLKRIAEQEGTSIAELLRSAIRWLLFIRTIKMDPTTRLLVQRGEEAPKEIIVDLALV